MRLEEKDISFHEGRLSILLELKRLKLEKEIKENEQTFNYDPFAPRSTSTNKRKRV
jgi:hypothetical protein